MDSSAANTALWNIIVQSGIICSVLLAANILRRKIPGVKKSLLPTAVIAGFILLIVRTAKIIPVDAAFLDKLTYHGIAIGFIALSLRVSGKESGRFNDNFTALKSGAVIVSTYLVQGLCGLSISLVLAYTFIPTFFKASGILLPMGYGQGPGQANNIGATYEALGFTGGRSYALAIAACGFLVACVAGVIYLNILQRQKKIMRKESSSVSGSVTIDLFQSRNELPVSESVDRFSLQIALVLIVYMITYFAMYGSTSAITKWLPSVQNLLNPLIWGFNFMIAVGISLAVKSAFHYLQRHNMMNHQYQNDYLLSRISGFAFDIMIIAGIASIDIRDIQGLWIPFLLTSTAGGIATFSYLRWICGKIYKGYETEEFFGMFGMLTGTIGSGILLVREIDPAFETPAANSLVSGSGTAVFMGVPVLFLIGIAPQSDTAVWLVFFLVIAYLALLLLFMLKLNRKRKML
jgi:glutamate:Na+ symporter, ESS family